MAFRKTFQRLKPFIRALKKPIYINKRFYSEPAFHDSSSNITTPSVKAQSDKEKLIQTIIKLDGLEPRTWYHLQYLVNKFIDNDEHIFIERTTILLLIEKITILKDIGLMSKFIELLDTKKYPFDIEIFIQLCHSIVKLNDDLFRRLDSLLWNLDWNNIKVKEMDLIYCGYITFFEGKAQLDYYFDLKGRVNNDLNYFSFGFYRGLIRSINMSFIKDERIERIITDLKSKGYHKKSEMSFLLNQFYKSNFEEVIEQLKMEPGLKDIRMIEWLILKATSNLNQKQMDEIKELIDLQDKIEGIDNRKVLICTLKGFIQGQHYDLALDLFFKNKEAFKKDNLLINDIIEVIIKQNKLDLALEVVEDIEISINPFIAHQLLLGSIQQMKFDKCIQLMEYFISKNVFIEPNTIELVFHSLISNKEDTFVHLFYQQLILQSNLLLTPNSYYHLLDFYYNDIRNMVIIKHLLEHFKEFLNGRTQYYYTIEMYYPLVQWLIRYQYDSELNYLVKVLIRRSQLDGTSFDNEILKELNDYAIFYQKKELATLLGRILQFNSINEEKVQFGSKLKVQSYVKYLILNKQILTNSTLTQFLFKRLYQLKKFQSILKLYKHHILNDLKTNEIIQVYYLKSLIMVKDPLILENIEQNKSLILKIEDWYELIKESIQNQQIDVSEKLIQYLERKVPEQVVRINNLTLYLYLKKDEKEKILQSYYYLMQQNHPIDYNNLILLIKYHIKSYLPFPMTLLPQLFQKPPDLPTLPLIHQIIIHITSHHDYDTFEAFYELLLLYSIPLSTNTIPLLIKALIHYHQWDALLDLLESLNHQIKSSKFFKSSRFGDMFQLIKWDKVPRSVKWELKMFTKQFGWFPIKMEG